MISIEARIISDLLAGGQPDLGVQGWGRGEGGGLCMDQFSVIFAEHKRQTAVLKLADVYANKLVGGQLQGGAAGAVPGAGGAPQDGPAEAKDLPAGHHHQHWQGGGRPGAPLPRPEVEGGTSTYLICKLHYSQCLREVLSISEPLSSINTHLAA